LIATLRLDLAIADIDHGDLIHLHLAMAVLAINAKHCGTVFAHAEIIGGQGGSHYQIRTRKIPAPA